jgi:pimeloyl-ACP methyl ester carboxylesterase
MARVHANGIEIEYETTGEGPPLLLIMGFTMQLIQWPDGFVERLAAKGFRVTRFDNRDVGLSSKVEARYTLDDMADDTAGLLDALGAAPAHVVGASMGGFIAQLLALRHHDKVRTLASIMSTTGAPGVGAARPDLIPVLMAPPPKEREAYIESRAGIARMLTGSRLRSDEARVRATIGRAYDRAFYPAGIARQFQAILAGPDRTAALAGIRVPTVVIHGSDAVLVDPSGGDATARAIPGARLVRVDGMGHDLPEAAWDTVIDAIVENARRG